MAYQTPLTIAKVIKDISSNKYVLPSIQREYVWDAEQIETLFDSLMREYPIGTFLFWQIDKDHVRDYDFYAFMKNYHEVKNKHNEKIDLKGSDRNEVCGRIFVEFSGGNDVGDGFYTLVINHFEKVFQNWMAKK